MQFTVLLLVNPILYMRLVRWFVLSGDDLGEELCRKAVNIRVPLNNVCKRETLKNTVVF